MRNKGVKRRKGIAERVRELPLRYSLTLRFGVSLVLLLLIVLLVDQYGVPFTSISGRFRAQRNETFRNLERLADEEREQILFWFKECDAVLALFTQTPFTRDMVPLLDQDAPRYVKTNLHDSEAASSLFLQFLRELILKHPEYLDAGLFDAGTGRCFLATDSSHLNENLSSYRFSLPETSEGRLLVSPVQIDSLTGNPLLRFASPVVDPQTQKPFAYLVVTTQSDFLVHSLLNADEVARDVVETVIVDRQRKSIIYLHHTPEGVRARGVTYRIDALPARLAAAGKAGRVEALDYRGVPVLAVYRYIPFSATNGWGLVIKRDREEVFSSLRHETHALYILGICILLFGLFSAWISVQSATKPLEILAAAARKVSAGDFSTRTNLEQRNELGTLSRSFDSMIGQLSEWHTDLEGEVERRTLDLIKSQSRLHQALAVAKGGYFEIIVPHGKSIFDPDLFINLSPEVKQMVGLETGDTISVPQWLDCIHPNDRSEHESLLKGYEDGTRNSYHSIYRFNTLDGKTLWLRSHSVLTPGEDASIWAGILLDVTELKETVRETLKLKESLEAVINFAPLAIIQLNLHGEVLLYNPEAERIFGWSPEEVIGSFSPIVPIEEHNVFLENLKTVAEGNHIGGTETRRLRKDGTLVDISLFRAPLHGEDGKVESIIGIMEDITDRKRYERELRHLNEDLEERVRLRTSQLEMVNKELESFAYSVSHDLRAPLRSLDGFSQALEEDYRDQLDETALDYTARIRGASQRMGKLIDALLVLSRVTRAELHHEELDLSELALEIGNELQASSSDGQVEYIVEPQMRVTGDRQLVGTLMRNLIGNAWKFSHKRKRPRIEVGSLKDKGELLFFVRDNGAGFNPVHAEHLFEPFQRLHTQGEFEGTGIGLATVERIVRQHGGFIRAESSIDHGATFYFSLAPSLRGEYARPNSVS